MAEPDITYYKEQLTAKEDMLARTTQFLVGTQKALEKMNNDLSETQRGIFESVSFANIIQTSLQPDINVLKVFFKDANYKVLQQIGIGGDTVFIKSTNTGVFFGLLDATGHGIPAAMLSTSGLLILNELSHSLALDSPKTLLELLNYRLFNTFNKNKPSVAHFEGAVFHYSYQTNKICYSSANGKALLLTKEGNISQIPVTKASIGENQQISLDGFQLSYSKGDKLILYSDGLVDQFGGNNNRKYMRSQLKRMLGLYHTKSASELTDIILNDHIQWRGSNIQTDDVSFKIIEF